MKHRKNLSTLALFLVATVLLAGLSAWAAIPLPSPITKTTTVDKWYITTLVIEWDTPLIVLTCPVGTGDGADFVPSGKVVQIRLTDGEQVKDGKGNPAVDADGKPVLTADYSDALNALRSCVNKDGVNAFDLLLQVLSQKAIASGALNNVAP